eukprot:TRINITY_DN56207_c0_g1_i1.p1 TRINITY_DN56207_c0_g1~~TRINITY_DN56207_c0_g1_i1.p1  ORF type:complete len:416 (+),score=66.21 TRINITY_DN56207_c0_g1_i1:58-1305(+)
MADEEDIRHWTPSPGGGRRHLRMAMSSTVDTLLLGRDLDQSGDNPHEDFMKQYGSYAGMKSADKDQRPFRRPGVAQSSVMDQIIYGRDLDFSGEDAYADFLKRFGHYAGKKSGNKVQKPFRKPGMSQASVVDGLIYNHDLDGSGDNPHEEFMNRYGTHAGKKSQADELKEQGRNVRILNTQLESSMQNIIHGGINAAPLVPDANPHVAYMKMINEGAAGLAVRPEESSPCKPRVTTLATSVDKVVFHKDDEPDEEDNWVDFTEFAGSRSGGIIRKRLCLSPSRKASLLASSVSTPALFASRNASPAQGEELHDEAVSERSAPEPRNLESTLSAAVAATPRPEEGAASLSARGFVQMCDETSSQPKEVAASITPTRINPFGGPARTPPSCASARSSPNCSRSSVSMGSSAGKARWK